jgi:hypothetical protein
LSCPIVSDPEYLVSCGKSPRNISIGPGWLDDGGNKCWLSDYSDEKDDVEIKILKENKDIVDFTLAYRNLKGCGAIFEKYRIDKEGLAVTYTAKKYNKDFFVQLPLLKTDGINVSKIEIIDKAFIVIYIGCRYKVECICPENIELSMEPFETANRNGIYKTGLFRSPSSRIILKICLEP